MKRSALNSTVALALVVVLSGTLVLTPASADSKTHRSPADVVRIVKKSDPGTRTIGRVSAVRGKVRAAGVEVAIAAPGDVATVGDETVMGGDGVDYVSRAVDEGFQVAAVISDATQSVQTYRFQGKHLELTKAGFVIVRTGGRTGEPVAVIDPAWAVDARGAKIASSFRVDGDTLIQTSDVDRTTAFPVVADPRVRAAWYGLSIDFTKAETKALSKAGNTCSALLGFASIIAAQSGGVTVAVIVAALTAGCGTIGALADAAYSSGKCISLKIFLALPGLTAPWIAKCYK